MTETSDVRHESEVDVSSQLGESNGQTENTTESTPGQEANDLSDELSEVDLDLEISESLDLDIDDGLEEIDLEEFPMNQTPWATLSILPEPILKWVIGPRRELNWLR